MDWDTMGKRVCIFRSARYPYTHINSKCPKGLQELSDIILLLCPPVVTPQGPLFSSSAHTASQAVHRTVPVVCMCRSHLPRRPRPLPPCSLLMVFSALTSGSPLDYAVALSLLLSRRHILM